MPNVVAPDIFHQPLLTFSRPHVERRDGRDLPRAWTPVGAFPTGRAAAAWLCSLGEGLKTEPLLVFVAGEPSACKGLGGQSDESRQLAYHVGLSPGPSGTQEL